MRRGASLSSLLPCGFLTGRGEFWNALAYLDQSKVGKLCQVILVDQPFPLRIDIFQCPSEIDGIEPELGKGVFGIHSAFAVGPAGEPGALRNNAREQWFQMTTVALGGGCRGASRAAA
jgi:hypothetical protein